MKRLSIFAVASFLLTSSAWPAVHSVGLDKKLYTSDFMMGNVIVSVIFPESNGQLDPNTENWSDDRKTQVLSQIISGLSWWPKQNPKIPLHFTVVSQTVPTKYEPITRPYYDEQLWIPDIMSRLGYNGSRFSSTRDYVNDLRDQYGADWGYIIFVVDSLNDTDGKFADGLFAYAYLGGPYLMLTYDNNGYGIGNMDVVAAHETGHIFYALDEYAGASSPQEYSYGYFPTINGNHVYSTVADAPDSIMRGGIRWGLDRWARDMIGWRDADADGRMDLVQQSPLITVSPVITASGANQLIGGDAKIQVVARQNNASGNGFTIDTISKVQYKLATGDWADASPTDGQFDSADEQFQISVGPSQLASIKSVTLSAQDVQVRAVTELAQYGTSATGGGSSSPVTSLDDAHPYPNPFKPNSALGHTNITFTHLTSGAKVQVFSPNGESVFEKTTDTSGTLIWDATNSDGQPLASGVYLYYITDGAGNKKKGKLAVIR